ncbi:Spo0B domain-containing protein [Virgibacillus siamensis]|uniref:Spo0B domain-containing protein n=1 Tax=Virgibacillus siamensis TaxID=480071 RepID=UPI000984C630|nr:Spo0B domain-containing protein [Virgibacillus siamensis]
MNEEDVINLLRHYRHDLLNHLQVVQGYLSMQKPEKAKNKMNALMEFLDEERKLVNLNAPAFALYILQFNTYYENVRLSYTIHTNQRDLQKADNLLVRQCEQIMMHVSEITDKMNLYTIHLQLGDKPDHSGMNVDIFIEGTFATEFKLNGKESMDMPVQVSHCENGIECNFEVPCK